MRLATRFALIIILAFAALATYEWLDTSVSLNYARQQQKTDEADSDLLRKIVLVNANGMNRAEVERLIKDNFAEGYLVKRNQRQISIDDLVFQFNEDQALIGISFERRSDTP